MLCGNCAEAAALRAAFPEEIGGELCNDEVGGRKVLDVQVNAVAARNDIDSITNMITGSGSQEATDVTSSENERGDDGHQDQSHGSQAGNSSAENQDAEPADDVSGSLVATFNKELAACKKKGEFEALGDEIDQSPDWIELRSRAPLYEECKKQITRAIARLKA